MTTTVYNLNGYPNNTDIGSVAGFSRAYGTNVGDIIVNADGYLDATNSPTMAIIDSGALDHAIHAAIVSGNTSNSFPSCVCIKDVGEFYGVRYDNGGSGVGFYIYQFVSSIPTLIGGVSGSMSAGDYLGLKYSGGKLTAYKNFAAISGLVDLTPVTVLDPSNLVGFHARQSNTDYIDSFTVESFPPSSITTVNGGNPVKVGSTFNSTVANFTGVTSGTLGGKALTGLSYSSNTITATLPAYADTGTYFEPDTNQTLTFVNGSETASLSVPTDPPVDMLSVVLSSPNMVDPTYLTYHIPTATNNDRIVFPSESGTFTVAAGGKVTCSTSGLRVLYHWNSENSVVTQLNVTVNEAGEVVNVHSLTVQGLTSTGLTSAGLSSQSL